MDPVTRDVYCKQREKSDKIDLEFAAGQITTGTNFLITRRGMFNLNPLSALHCADEM